MIKKSVRICGILFLCLISITCYADCESDQEFTIPPASYPKIQVTGKTESDFIPANWRKVESIKDDLNNDGLSDFALAIVENDPNKIIKDKCGLLRFDSNPFAIIVLFKQKNGTYKLAAKDFNLIPRLTDPILDQPFNSIESKNGVLKISYHYWQSMGSWTSVGYVFTFRFQQGCLKLIGLDYSTFHRASHEEGLWSANFNTGKIIETHNFPDATADDPAPEKPTEKRYLIKNNQKMCLGKLPSEDFINNLIFNQK